MSPIRASQRALLISHSWEEIADTSGRSDEAQRQLLRNTLAYQTFTHLSESKSEYFVGSRILTGDDHGLTIKGFSAEYELDPEEAGQPPLAIELSARFPDWTAEEIDHLMQDHRDEIAQLDRWREAGLERMIREVKELVRRDTQGVAGEAGDVAM